MSGGRGRLSPLRLVLVPVVMFGFAFALVPLYQVFCELTGLNGKTTGQAAVEPASGEHSERELTLHLMAKVARGMPWDFRPSEEMMQLRAGEMYTTSYVVRNHSRETLVGQAVPSVSPGRAARYLKKVECFCFTQQQLLPGEEMELPVNFYVSEDLPADINTLSLSYTMFRLGEDGHQHMAKHEE